MTRFSFNRLQAGETPAPFSEFRISPMRVIRAGTDAEAVTYCRPEERDFWAIHAETDHGRRFIHEARDDAGAALLALSKIEGASFYYSARDPDTGILASFINTFPGRLEELPDRLAEIIHDDLPGYDDPEDFRDDDFDAHPVTELREQIVDAIEGRAG